jgi:hypothetical protein
MDRGKVRTAGKKKILTSRVAQILKEVLGAPGRINRRYEE